MWLKKIIFVLYRLRRELPLKGSDEGESEKSKGGVLFNCFEIKHPLNICYNVYVLKYTLKHILCFLLIVRKGSSKPNNTPLTNLK